jgi:Reverse transcriptase (RNA-dependent DNA polymerase)
MRPYEFGEQLMHFFVNCWRDSYIVPHPGGVFGPRVEVNLVMQQGDVVSPLLFNLVVDAILCHVDATLPHLATSVKKIFYADDSRLGSQDQATVKEVLNLVTIDFAKVGLFMNTTKTVSMTNRKFFCAIHKDVCA